MNTLLALSQPVGHLVLAAAGTDSQSKVSSFFSGGLGSVIQDVFIVVGIIVVILTVGRSLKSFAEGKMGDVAKKLVGGIIAAVICFNLQLPFGLIAGATTVVSDIMSQISDTISGK